MNAAPAGDVDPGRTPSAAIAAPRARKVCQFTGAIASSGQNPEKFFQALRAANDRLEELARQQGVVR